MEVLVAVDSGWELVETDLCGLRARKRLLDFLFVSRLWSILDWASGRLVQVHGCCLRDVLRPLHGEDLVDGDGVELLISGVVGVGVVPHHLVEKVATAVVVKE